MITKWLNEEWLGKKLSGLQEVNIWCQKKKLSFKNHNVKPSSCSLVCASMTRGMKALKSLPNTYTDTQTHTNADDPIGRWLPVSVSSRLCSSAKGAGGLSVLFEVQQAVSVLTHVADGKPELDFRREKGHPGEISHRKQKSVQKPGYAEKNSVWHTQKALFWSTEWRWTDRQPKSVCASVSLPLIPACVGSIVLSRQLNWITLWSSSQNLPNDVLCSHCHLSPPCRFHFVLFILIPLVLCLFFVT